MAELDHYNHTTHTKDCDPGWVDGQKDHNNQMGGFE